MADDKRNLTVNDPVDPETLATLDKLEMTRYDVGLRLLQLEQEKVRLLTAAHRIDEQQRRTFEKVLMERGEPPNAQVEIDTKTGKITLLRPTAPEPEKSE